MKKTTDVEKELYRDVQGRAGCIVRRGEEEYIIIRFHDSQVALFKCDIEKEIAEFKLEGRYFVNLTNPYMGHAMRFLSIGQELESKWLWKPIEYIDDFEVIYEY